MTYNPKNVEVITRPTVPPDLIIEGVVINITDGKPADFFKNMDKWKGDRDQEAIKVEVEVLYNGFRFNVDDIFTYNQEQDKTQFSNKSNLGKYYKKYGKIPEVGDRVKCFSNSQGYFKLKID